MAIAETTHAIVTAVRSHPPKTVTHALQIGASDGTTGDPLHALIPRAKKWLFRCVEPRPQMVAKLNQLHAEHNNVVIHQACIVEDELIDAVEMYEFAAPELPRWAGGIASLDRRLLERISKKHFNSSAEIRTVRVVAQTLEAAMRQMAMSRVDVVVTDMEGYDQTVIIPIVQYSPIVICFEHMHMPNATRRRVNAALKPDYDLVFTGEGEQVWSRKRSG